MIILENTETKRGKAIDITVIVIAILLGILIMIRVFVVEPVKVQGNSMDDTLHTGEKYLIYKLGNIERNDIVVFTPPTDDKNLYIKRVIGVEGDKIKLVGNKTIVNGKVIDEPYLEFNKNALDVGQTLNGEHPEQKVKKGHIYVLGDNRLNSEDSREFGQVSLESVRGTLIKR